MPVQIEHLDSRTALVCEDDPGRKAQAAAALRDLSYRVSLAISPQDALERLKLNHYDIIFLDESFGKKTDEPVLAYLNKLPMSVRRTMIVALASQDLSTLSYMDAFVRSVNVVVNYGDVSKLTKILTKIIEEHKRLYKIFSETALELGKA